MPAPRRLLSACRCLRRTTVTVYFEAVSPSSAVTLTLGVVIPTASSTWWPAITASASSGAISILVPAAAVAEPVVSATAFPTDAVYAVVPVAKAGFSVTPLSESALRLASADPARVTTRARQFEQIL